jgi:hypothetical protein
VFLSLARTGQQLIRSVLQTTVDKARFDKMSRYFACKLDYLVGCCQIWAVKFDPVAARNCSIWSLECRLVVDKLSGDKDPLDEPVWYTLFRALKACMRARLPLSNRIIRAAWFVSVAISPRVFARRLIALRFVITERPAWFERILTTVANIASWRGSGRIHAADSLERSGSVIAGVNQGSIMEGQLP